MAPTPAARDSSTVYIGRIPHGFYEHQMRAYFSQFGRIARLRLSRNRRTGASKHYAFIEFESAEVADVVARTMDKYLLFGHILQVKVVPPEHIHPELWKNAEKRFKRIPWAKLQRDVLAGPKGRGVWARRVDREMRRRTAKQEKLREMGYEFDMVALKPVPAAQQTEADAGERPAGETPKAIAATLADEEITVDTLLQQTRPQDASDKAKVRRSKKKAAAA